VLSHEHLRQVKVWTGLAVEDEGAILDAFEEGTESIREVAQELNISKTCVHQVMKSERRNIFKKEIQRI
jgi:predicted DNA-binding protein YlxM (UPF0122 family)